MPAPTPRPYTAYKPSGAPWLGDVPAHWEARRIGTIAQILNGATPSTSNPDYWDGNIIWVTPDDLGKLKGRYITGSARKITAQGYRACGTTLAAAGSITISTRAPIGHLGILLSDACVNQGCRLLIPDGAIDSEYLYYALSTTSSTLASFGQGSTFTELSRTLLAAFRLPLPPLPEQAAIVRYLDHVDRRIRLYVDAKERLVALLEEEKQAVVNRAVTRGLDPNVRLKPSGVDWLGDVPGHWEVRRLGQIATSFRTGPFGSTLHQSDYIEGGTPIVNPVHMRGGQIVEDSNSTVSKAVAERLSDYKLGMHDLVFSRRGELGRCVLVRERETNWLCGTGSIRVRITHLEIAPEFLIQALQGRWVGEYLSAFSVGTTMPNLNTGILKGVPITLPPVHEQVDILESVGKSGLTIDAAVSRARRQIEFLQEYRTRLIADVVTGKLDVRQAAAKLPGEPNKLEALA